MKKIKMPGYSLFLIGLLFLMVIGVYTYQLIGGQKTEVVKEALHVFLIRNKTLDLEEPKLPDISGYTVEIVGMQAAVSLEENKNFKAGTAATMSDIEIINMRDDLDLREFTKRDGRLQIQRLSRKDVRPKAIVVKNGSYDFHQVFSAIKNQVTDDLPLEEIIIKEGKTYTLRMPLLVSPGASLRISGDTVQELRLSKNRASFIVNAGNLYIIKTRIVGWDEAKKTNSHYVDPESYRPFITSWGGGKLVMAGCEVESLGYHKGKSYGLTYSTCKECIEVNPKIEPPTGVLVGNKFKDMYYGFYSYEAKDVAIISNKYMNNQIYAIDPHDRSRRLIIALNEIHGTKKKHGIIISREVNDSWIFKNHSHHNVGSGIMIDRSSINNMIAYNLSEHNNQDGLTFFESQKNTSWNNKLLNNKRNGIKARNSWDLKLYNDTIIGNGAAPVNIYTADISDQASRDFTLDPYTQHAGAEIIGATIKTHLKGAIKIGTLEPLFISKLFITPATTPILTGNKLPNNMRLVQMLRTDQHQLKIQPKSNLNPDGEFISEIIAQQ